jgi:hypothetical protein
MAKKFITLHFRCGADYLNSDWIYDLVIAYYIAKFNLKNCRHVSLSVGAFSALMWKFGNTLYTGAPDPLTTEELNLIKTFIENGAGLIYEETTSSITPYPEPQVIEKRLDPIDNYPELPDTRRFEDFVNAACRRFTEAYDPFTGAKLENDDDYRYGLDAVHAYLMRVGDPPVQHKVVICKSHLVDWVAAWLCGVERGEFGGPCPFGPNTLPQNLTENEAPEKTWLDNFVDDFAEVPFYFICGLQTFVPIKNLGEHDDGDPKNNSELTNLDEIRVDDNGDTWCYPSMVERAQWLYDYLTSNSAVADKRVGAFITSRSCHATLYDWLKALENPGNEVPHYEKFRIPTGGPVKPASLAEAHLDNSQMGSDLGEYGFWKAQFEAFLDYIEDVWFDDPDIILFSDREAKDMVVQQYDQANPPVTMNATRLQKIAEFLADVNIGTTKWQINSNEWGYFPPKPVTRPPNYVKITINEEDEYYSLAEAYSHLLSALNDLANGNEITYKVVDPVIGPCEPDICPNAPSPFEDEDDSVYRIFVWWQHVYNPLPIFSCQNLLSQIPALYEGSKSFPIGPTFPDLSRQRVMVKVRALWKLVDDLGVNKDLNAAEILYLLAKAMYFYYHPTTADSFEMFPSHVLPIGYRIFLENGRFKNIFGDNLEHQLNWFDIGQRWTLKPAVLNELIDELILI